MTRLKNISIIFCFFLGLFCLGSSYLFAVGPTPAKPINQAGSDPVKLNLKKTSPVEKMPIASIGCKDEQRIPMAQLSAKKIASFLDQHKINSLDILLSCLPKIKDWEAYTLVHTSVSPESEDISVEYPRVILVAKQGALTISYTGNIINKGMPNSDYDVIRVLEFDDAVNKFNITEIKIGNEFKKKYKGSVTFYESKQNQGVCSGCHSPNAPDQLRPIWSGYRQWFNAFGSKSDGEWSFKPDVPYHDDTKQYLDFKKFLLKNMNGTRYSPLVKHILKGVAPDGLENFLKDDSALDAKKPPEPMNSEITDRFIVLNGKRIASDLTKSPDFGTYQFPILASFLGCEIPELFQDYENEFADDPDYADYYDIYQSYKEKLSKLSEQDYGYGSYHDQRRYAMLMSYSKKAGLDPLGWEMDIFKATKYNGSSVTPESGPALFDGFFTQDFYVLKSLISSYKNGHQHIVDAVNKLFSIKSATNAVYDGVPLSMATRINYKKYGPDGGYPVFLEEQCSELAGHL